jgi:hypothetical protein
MKDHNQNDGDIDPKNDPVLDKGEVWTCLIIVLIFLCAIGYAIGYAISQCLCSS